MTTEQQKNSIEAMVDNNDIDITDFSISVNETIFKMCISDTYINHTLAVIREWSTNACDACINAEKEVKFDVHLPTLKEPYFSTRDYGTGLSEQDIKGLFSSLGESTKRNSNKFNGVLGIGRMAGLAVSDAFTVDSYYNRKLYTYVITIYKGKPVTIKLGEYDTDEENGLKLTVPVPYEKVNAYSTDASYLYKFFDYKPNLNIDLDLDINEEKSITGDWGISKDGFSNKNIVVMAQVPYEIPQNANIETYGFRKIVLRAEPGSVSFNPGREILSLDDKTITYLNNRFKKVKDEYLSSILLMAAEAANDVEINNLVNSTYSSSSAAFINDLNIYSLYSKYCKSLDYSLGTDKKINLVTTGTDSFKKLSEDKLSIFFKLRHQVASKTIKDNGVTVNNFFNAVHVIYDVKENLTTALAKKFTGEALITWKKAAKTELADAVNKAKEFLEGMGIKYILLSDLVKDGSVVKTSTKEVKAREGFYGSFLRNGSFSKPEKLSEDIIEKPNFIFVKLNNTTPEVEDCPENTTYHDLLTAYRILAKVEKDMPTLVGVPKKYQSIVFDREKKVTLLKDYILDKIKKSSFTMFPADSAFTVNRSLSSSSIHNFNSDIQQLYCDYKTIINEQRKSTNLSSIDYELVTKLGGNVIVFDTSDIDNRVKEVLRVYKVIGPILLNKAHDTLYYCSPETVAYFANLERLNETLNGK